MLSMYIHMIHHGVPTQYLGVVAFRCISFSTGILKRYQQTISSDIELARPLWPLTMKPAAICSQPEDFLVTNLRCMHWYVDDILFHMYLLGAIWHPNRRVAYIHVGVGLVLQWPQEGYHQNHSSAGFLAVI
jgi:hypothetical protein